MNRPVRGLFFDVGDTLVRPTEAMPTVLTREAAGVGVKIEADALATVAALTRARLAERAATRRPFSFPPGESRRFWTGIYLDVLHQHASAAQATEIAERVYAHFSMPAAYAVYPDVMPALRRLRSHGFRLGIISNWESWIGSLLTHHELDTWFEWVVASGDVEVEKPDRRIFEIALQRSGLSRPDVLYVGDSPAIDIAGARRAGWRAILVEREDGDRPGPDGVTTIRSLAEIAPLLASDLTPFGDQANRHDTAHIDIGPALARADRGRT